MKAMVLESFEKKLSLKDLSRPKPKEKEVLIKVSVCGVCRTDVHIINQELDPVNLPLILGHQIIGTIEKLSNKTSKHKIGERVGVPWLGKSCQSCEFCLEGKENLCDNAEFTGYTKNGGFAEYCTAHEDYIFSIPSFYDDIKAAPLLCAGLIGYRAFKLAKARKKIGLYGFGSSAHLLIQVANHLGYDVYVFTRPKDEKKQKFALSLGAVWAGGSDQMPPSLLDSCIIFAPVGKLYIRALQAIKKGGHVISAGIHMSDIPAFPYSFLWGERSISSVANLTREDGYEFMKLLQDIHIESKVTCFPLNQANEALLAIKQGQIDGSVVLTIQNIRESNHG